MSDEFDYSRHAPCTEEEWQTVVDERDRYREALNWALGGGDNFPERTEGQGAYWWRAELRKRAALTWNGWKFVPELS